MLFLGAIAVSLFFVTLYYVMAVVISIGVQKYLRYDKPNGLLYLIIDFPMDLPALLYKHFVPQYLKDKVELRRQSRRRDCKAGYLNRSALFYFASVILYTLPAYLLLARL
jgi:hypothetical protein